MQVARGVQQETDNNYSNDSIGNANALSLFVDGAHRTATVQGTLVAQENSNTDEDYFALGLLSAGNTVELSTRLPSNNTLQPYVTLRDASGAIIPDEDGNPWDGQVLVTLPEDGEYYARVETLSVYNDHVYLLTESTGNWSSVEAQAVEMGGHLVTIDDAAEQAWITEHFAPMGNLWIGASDAASEGTFL